MSLISEGQLEAGQSYLHRNFQFIRTIDRMEGDTVLWHDQIGPGRCSRKVFVRQCLAVAPEDELGLLEIKAEVARGQGEKVSPSEIRFQQMCTEAIRASKTEMAITDPRLLGDTYEVVMRNLLVLGQAGLALRIVE
jgi:hypothetical protein